MSVGWELAEGGGLLDDADIFIEKSYFGYDAAYHDGEDLILIFEGTTDGTDDGTFRQLYSLGAGWETNDRGKTMEHPSGRSLTKTSNYGLFIQAAFEAGAEDVVKDRGTPDEASIWEGLRFHMKRTPVERPGLEREDGRAFEVLLPVAYLGEGDGSDKKDKKAKKAKSTGDKAMRAKVVLLAKKADSHDEFVEAVLDKYPTVEDDADLFADVLDDEGGIWAQVQ